MTGTHGIDVHLLHDADILQHPFTGHHITVVGVHLVAVGSLNQYRTSVDAELSALDFHLAEAHLDGDNLAHPLAVGILSQQGI